MASASLVLIIGSASHAQTTSNRSLLPVVAQTSSTRLTLSTSGDFYLGANQASFSPSASSVLSDLSLSLLHASRNRQNQWALDGDIHWANQDQSLYLDIREGYFSTPLLSGELSLGRRLVAWSEADNFWRLGLWQARILRDKLERPNLGLIGLFWKSNWDSSPWQVQVMGSPIFIPDLGTDLAIVDHTFHTANPWFHAPTPKVLISGVETDIHYSLSRLPNEQMIQHPGAAIQVQYGSSSEDHLQMSLAHKPMQLLMLAFPYYLFVGPSERFVSIELTTRVFYQQIATLEYVLQAPGRNWRAWASMTYENPIADQQPDTWVTQELIPARIASFYVESTLTGAPLRGFAVPSAYASATYLVGGDSPDQGPIAQPHMSFFESRFFFKRALQLGLKHGWQLDQQRKLAMDLHGIFDFAQAGLQLSAQLQYSIDSRWLVLAKADWLALTNNVDAAMSPGFFGYYRANDRVHLGVSYVF